MFQRGPLLLGIPAGLVGLVVGWWVWRTASGSGYEMFPLAAALAAFLSGAWLWRRRMGGPEAQTYKRAAFTGALAAVTGHFLCWYFLILEQNFCYWLWGDCAGSLGEPPLDPLRGVAGAAGMGLLSLLFLGWLTVPAGSLLGLLALRLQGGRGSRRQ